MTPSLQLFLRKMEIFAVVVGTARVCGGTGVVLVGVVTPEGRDWAPPPP